MESKKLSQPAHINEANFEETLKNNKVVFIDFWASWCGPCRALAPTVEEIAKEYSGKVLVGKLDVDENPTISERFNVYSIPTMIIFKNGAEVDKIIGLCPKKSITDALAKQL
jgi:thioredoxin 1